MVLGQETDPSWWKLQSQQVKFIFLLIYFLIFSFSFLLVLFYMLSLYVTCPFPQLPRPLHVEAECEARGQRTLQQNDLNPLHQTAAE